MLTQKILLRLKILPPGMKNIMACQIVNICLVHNCRNKITLNSNARCQQRPADNFPIGSTTDPELIFRNPTESLHRGPNLCSSVDATEPLQH